MKFLIADPQPSVRRALSVWIRGQSGCEIAGEAGSSDELLNKMGQLLPEVVIVERDLPGLPTPELVALVRQAWPGVVLILLSSSPLEHSQKEDLDVDFIVSKVDPPYRMLDVIAEARRRQAG